MAEYPYIQTPTALTEFISKLKKAGKPDKIDKKYLDSMGYTSSNHRRIPGVLQFIGLIDQGGVPTEKYQALRDSKGGPAKLESYIRDAYSDLFKLYPDAHRKDSEALQSFFRAHTDLGKQAVSAMATTFQRLCELTTFQNGVGAEAPKKPEAPAAPVAKKAATETSIEPPVRQAPSAGGIIINVNIQLELPADSKVYDELFAAMAKHIFRMDKE